LIQQKKLLGFKINISSISLIDRYILAELFPPLLFSVGIFSSLGVAVGTLSDLANKVFELNLPSLVAAQIFCLKIPEFAAYALPIATLLATLMTYGRLSNDSELIAFRASGITIYRAIVPALILSALVTGITFLFNELVVPAANYQATNLESKYIKIEKSLELKQDIFYPEYETVIQADGTVINKLKSLFFATKFDGKNMQDVTVLKWSRDKLEDIIIAKSGTWNENNRAWDFRQGTVYPIAANNSYKSTIAFAQIKVFLSKNAFELARLARDPYEMNIAQASEYLKILRSSGDEKKIAMFEVRTQQKIAFPFVCMVFGLLGSVLGSSPQQSSKSKSFGLCLIIVFAYYLIGFLIGGLGLVKVLSPLIAAWLPNLFGFAVGIWLSYEFSN
jgi:lipopolysaccharide export system permease protein